MLHDPGFVSESEENSCPTLTPTAELVSWANEVRPAGDPEVTDANIMTAARFADALDVAFREGVSWWGG
jgi:hypothetical protein